MRVLVLSNLYPPHAVGGYEMGCHDVVGGLRARGHDVLVLTSGVAGPPGGDEEGTRRPLRLVSPISTEPAPPLARRLASAAGNVAAVAGTVARWHPDVVYAWNARGLGRPILRSLGLLPAPVVLFVFDHWYQAMAGEGWRSKATLGGGRRLHAQFGSAFLASGFPAGRLRSSAVIPWGLDPVVWAGPAPGRAGRHGLLYVGQVELHKGVHTAVEALATLHQDPAHHDLDLDVVGTLRNAAYAEELRHLARALGVEDHVRLVGGVDRAELVDRYRRAAVLVFPSTWEEPLGITLLEAMAAGLPVVATATGGSAELVGDGRGLAFPAGDAAACAAQLATALADGGTWSALSEAGRAFASQERTFDRMLDAVESHLLEVRRR